MKNTRENLKHIEEGNDPPEKVRKTPTPEIVLAARGLQDLVSTYNGIHFLRWLAKQCHASESIVSVNPQTGEINQLTSLYSESRRNLWLSIRAILPRQTIIDIEIPEKQEVKPDGE